MRVFGGRLRGWAALWLLTLLCAETLQGQAVAQEPEQKADPTLEAWKTLCTETPGLVEGVTNALLLEKDIDHPSLVLHDHQYLAKRDTAKSYGLVMSNFYFNDLLKAGTVAATFETVRTISKTATEFRTKNRPLLEKAETLEKLTGTLQQALSKTPADALKLKEVAFGGTGGDELSVSLRKLSEAAAGERADEAAVWAGEARGAAMRLVDLLRWVDLQTGWIVDLCGVFDRYSMCVENSDREVAAAGGWKAYMFGRIPGGSSILELCTTDTLMCEMLLCDFMKTSEADAAVMGKAGMEVDELAVVPAHRVAYAKVRDGIPSGAQKVFKMIPDTAYELSMLNSNLWRYDDEKKVDELIGSLGRYAKQDRKPTVTQMMEVIHIAQGAYGSTTSPGERYHKQMAEWAETVKGTPEKAIETVHSLAYGFYTKDGGRHYKGAIWTMHGVFEAGSMDCIRGSQMMGSTYANAGYAGLHPIRICRGSLAEKIVATSGHTFVCLLEEKRDVCLDSLVSRAFLKPFAQMHAGDGGVLSAARGYRTLDSYASGEMYFPQGTWKAVRFEIPYYGIRREGLETAK